MIALAAFIILPRAEASTRRSRLTPCCSTSYDSLSITLSEASGKKAHPVTPEHSKPPRRRHRRHFHRRRLEVGDRRFTAKILTTPRAPEEGVLTAVRTVIAEAGIDPAQSAW